MPVQLSVQLVALCASNRTLTLGGASSGTPPLSIITFTSNASHVTLPGSHRALTLIFTKAVLDKKGASTNERFAPGSVRSGGRVWAVNVEGRTESMRLVEIVRG